MKGSIRTFGGLLIVIGAAGGIEAGEPLIPAVFVAIVGLVIMANGVRALNKASKNV